MGLLKALSIELCNEELSVKTDRRSQSAASRSTERYGNGRRLYVQTLDDHALTPDV
ncbi:hypothetical protein AALP_AA4G056000 [Arabis alpina]|uniref:Uncharacterized protein n=1 Tax=Arabis alpina TaxID=50452 RepID=A0A087H1D2_ARAAL|nr:hypothetical protein AALP_AA4G056000 [Arabis alpina]